MLVLTEDAVLKCPHPPGHASMIPTQRLVTINGRRVLVEPNPEKCAIHSCPYRSITILPCSLTYEALAGYSELLWIQGQRVCLDTVEGLTEGTPPRFWKYTVAEPGQAFVLQNK